MATTVMHSCLPQVDPGTTMSQVLGVRPLVSPAREESSRHTVRSRLGCSEGNAIKQITAVTTKTVLGPWSSGYCGVSGQTCNQTRLQQETQQASPRCWKALEKHSWTVLPLYTGGQVGRFKSQQDGLNEAAEQTAAHKGGYQIAN